MKLFAALLTLLLASCAARGHRFFFQPSPLEVLVQESDGPLLARTLLSVPGAVRDDEDWPEMHVRILFENKVGTSLFLDATSVLLVGSNLQSFGAPRSPAGDRIELPAGESTTVELFFPFPDGMSMKAPELDGVNLQWTVEHAGRSLETSATLQRVPPPVWPHDDYGRGRVFIGFGYHDC
ncbi:MAG: hypothetical protein GY711_18155 [bacterium]|nr:hypothetical protein [bacterium]